MTKFDGFFLYATYWESWMLKVFSLKHQKIYYSEFQINELFIIFKDHRHLPRYFINFSIVDVSNKNQVQFMSSSMRAWPKESYSHWWKAITPNSELRMYLSHLVVVAQIFWLHGARITRVWKIQFETKINRISQTRWKQIHEPFFPVIFLLTKVKESQAESKHTNR